jgi:hypothetical protein
MYLCQSFAGLAGRSASLGCLLLIVSGCGTAAYEAKLNRALTESTRLTPFAALHEQSTTLPGTGISLRLPKIFDQAAASYAPGAISARDSTPDAEKVVDPKRLHPSFIQIPGLITTYEAFVAPPNQAAMPVYAYLGRLGKAESPTLTQDIAAQLKAKFPDKTAEWQEVSAPSPDLAADGSVKNVPWKKLSLTGINQDFDGGSPGSPSFYERAAQFELWVHEGEADVVVIGWSAPEALSGFVNLGSLAPAVAGTLKTGGAVAEGEGV